MPESGWKDQLAMTGGRKDDGKQGGSGGAGLDDLRLWKAFTHDIEPIHETDWQRLEDLIRAQSDDTRGIRKNPSPRENIAFSIPERTPPSAPKGPPQLDGRTEQRLRRGKLPIDGMLDLHGHRQESAHRMLTDFVLSAHKKGKRCLLIITGKGKSTLGGDIFAVPDGILRQKVPQWLSTGPLTDVVLKITPAIGAHGGSGAMYVYLKRNKN